MLSSTVDRDLAFTRGEIYGFCVCKSPYNTLINALNV